MKSASGSHPGTCSIPTAAAHSFQQLLGKPAAPTSRVGRRGACGRWCGSRALPTHRQVVLANFTPDGSHSSLPCDSFPRPLLSHCGPFSCLYMVPRQLSALGFPVLQPARRRLLGRVSASLPSACVSRFPSSPALRREENEEGMNCKGEKLLFLSPTDCCEI